PLHVPPCERAPLPGAGRAGESDLRGRLRRGSLPALRARDRRTASRSGGVSLATIRESPGLDAYLEGLEERLAAAVEACPGLVATVGAEALAAGGKRLRPLLVFLTAPTDTDPLPAGAAVELVHTATPVPDDLTDRPEYRRGRASAWACHGDEAARAAGDYLFARAFGELSATGDRDAVRLLARATLALARGEALQHV